MHPIGDQVADAREVFGFGDGDDIERSRDGVDSFHHRYIFERDSYFVGLANGCFDEDICACRQVNLSFDCRPPVRGAILFGFVDECQCKTVHGVRLLSHPPPSVT